VNTPKRREQDLFVRSGKSEAEVTNNRRLRSRCIVLLKLTTDRHEASRGLSTRAGLLVCATLQKNKAQKTRPGRVLEMVAGAACLPPQSVADRFIVRGSEASRWRENECSL